MTNTNTLQYGRLEQEIGYNTGLAPLPILPVYKALIITLFSYNTNFHYGPKNQCYNEVPVYQLFIQVYKVPKISFHIISLKSYHRILWL